MPTLHEKAAAFAAMHRGRDIIVLPNAWDPGSAVLMAEAGFLAIATTSAGVAFTQGLPDGQRIDRERMLALAGQIAAAVDVPVSADLEAGYGPRPDDVAATVRGALAAGLVGCNIEDSSGDASRPLFELPLAVERIHAGHEAARGAARDFVLNARVDPYLVRRGQDTENFAEAVRRANAYRAAGADCLFVPGPADLETITRLAREIDGPLNVLGARGGQGGLVVADLARVGVRRVSIGGSLSLAVLGFVRQALAEMRERGTFSYAAGALSNAEANRLMLSRAGRR